MLSVHKVRSEYQELFIIFNAYNFFLTVKFKLSQGHKKGNLLDDAKLSILLKHDQYTKVSGT